MPISHWVLLKKEQASQLMSQIVSDDGARTSKVGRVAGLLTLLLIAIIPLFEAPKNILALGLVGMGIWIFFTDKKKLCLFQWSLLLWLAVAALVSANTVVNNDLSASGFLDVFRYCSVGLAVTFIAKRYLKEHFLVLAVLLGTGGAVLLGLYEMSQGAFKLQLKSVGQVNHSAIYMVLGVCVGLPYLLFSNTPKIVKGVVALCLMIVIAGIVIAESRAVIAVMLLVFLMCIAASVMARKWMVVGAFFVAALMGTVALNDQIQKVFEKHQFWLDHYVAKGPVPRVQINTLNRFVFSQYPVLGIGYSNFSGYTADRLSQDFTIEELAPIREVEADYYGLHPHNIYYDQLVSSGLMGFSVFALTFGSVLLFLVRTRPRKEQGRYQFHWWWLSTLGMVGSVLSLGFFNTVIHHESALLMFIFLSYVVLTFDVETEAST